MFVKFVVKLMTMREKGGFTFAEVMIAMAIFIMLFALVAPVTLNFYRSRNLISERDNIVALLRRTRTLSLANRNGANHGLFIGSSSIVIFEGNSYAGRNVEFDEVFTRENLVTATGAREIVFTAPSGEATSTEGTTTISLSLGNNTQIIEFNQEGGILW